MNDLLTPRAANHVLFAFEARGDNEERLGYGAGAFITELIALFCKADVVNFARLEQGFPEYGAAVRLMIFHPDGVELLKEAAAPPR